MQKDGRRNFLGGQQLGWSFIPDNLKPPPARDPPGNRSRCFPRLEKPMVPTSATGAEGGVQALQKLGPVVCVEMTTFGAPLKICSFPKRKKVCSFRYIGDS